MDPPYSEIVRLGYSTCQIMDDWPKLIFTFSSRGCSYYLGGSAFSTVCYIV